MLARSLSVLALLFAANAGAASSDIFAYTDASGVTHYTNVPMDSRYRLVAASPPEPSADPARASAPREVDWAARAGTYSHMIDRAAKKSALQPALLRAVIAIESAFNPRAVSSAGAQGLMQLHPDTARRYGVGDAFDPEQNLSGGARYLSDLMRRYHNNLELVLAAYNAGEQAVDRYGRQIPPYRETQAYVPAVLRLYRQFLSNPARAT
jgi:soluble lytic murein transglycosylase-like protein